MDYIDLTKKRPKKEVDTTTLSSSSSENPGGLDFLGGLADAGKGEGSITESNKGDVIEILNLLNSKISNLEHKLHRIQRLLEDERYTDG